MQSVATGIMFDAILLASEYAPNSSGPSPLAKNLIINMIDMTDIMEVIVVARMSLRKGLNLTLYIYELKLKGMKGET